MSTIRNILIILLFIVCETVVSQTVNTGVMYVSPGTEFSTVEEFNNTNTGIFYNDGDSYIYNHFNNDGVVDFVEGGLIRFLGSDIQQISGLQRSYFYNVLFFNTSATTPFELSGSISVTNESVFDSGIVDNELFGGSFIYERNAFHTGTSNFSHVDGYVLKNGENYFKYPTGDGGYYRYAAISETGSATNAFEGKYFLQNSNSVYPHDSKEPQIELINDAEYWLIERTEGSPEDVMVTLSWSEETTPFEIYDNPQNDAIHIVRWDSELQEWVDEGGAVNETEKTVTTVINGFGIFTLARLNKQLEDDCTVYNAITPGQDNLNELFRVECADEYPDNNVKIFNRWGVKVFDRDGYNNDEVAFKGFSEGRVTIGKTEELPTGTYFYVIEFKGNENPGKKQYTGFLYINK